MLRLALEIPTSMLHKWAPLTDLDFILAHKVLADREYASFFYNRPNGREVILDNSTHEFGYPMRILDLQGAVLRCNSDYLITPDIVWPDIGDAQHRMNKLWFHETAATIGRWDRGIAFVVSGRTKEERDAFIKETVGKAQMICFSFHIPDRVNWWTEFTQHPSFDTWKRVHILGVDTLDEMKQWVEISENHTHINFSIDTTKPVKWGVQGKKLDELTTLRKGPVDAKAVLEIQEFTEEQIGCVEHNISLLRGICNGRG